MKPALSSCWSHISGAGLPWVLIQKPALGEIILTLELQRGLTHFKSHLPAICTPPGHAWLRAVGQALEAFVKSMSETS